MRQFVGDTYIVLFGQPRGPANDAMGCAPVLCGERVGLCRTRSFLNLGAARRVSARAWVGGTAAA